MDVKKILMSSKWYGNLVIKFVLQSEEAEIPKRKKGLYYLTSIIVDARGYRSNKSKPRSKRLKKKLQSVRNTQEYKTCRTTVEKKEIGQCFGD